MSRGEGTTPRAKAKNEGATSGKEKMKKKGYYRGVEKEMYLYFSGYDEQSAPSFSKFARLKGLTLEELLSFRKRKLFEKAYNECLEIRRDYLKDRALTKRFDPSFVKYLLDTEVEEEAVNDEIRFRLEVV